MEVLPRLTLHTRILALELSNKMADDSESLITEIVEETTGGEGLFPSARPRGRLYLNSSRLPTDVIKRIAVELKLPGTASRADTYAMLEGKLEDEPRNVQVKTPLS